MKIQRPFTLTELLVVIAIIAILAGLLIPAIVIGQQRGRITQAKADMKTILTALKSVEGTYQQMVKQDSGYMPKASSDNCVTLGKPEKRDDTTDTGTIPEYNKFIVELTDPSNTAVNSQLNINKRKIKFLDAQSSYDPTTSGITGDNIKHLWRDPWGNSYIIIINTDFTGRIPNPTGSGTLSGSAVMYSRGPNGADDDGKNTADGTGTGNQDDIVSWM